jgi:hypothetical protein
LQLGYQVKCFNEIITPEYFGDDINIMNLC